MSVIHSPKQPDFDARIVVFPVVMSLLLVVVFLRLWYIQVVKAPELVERAEASRSTTVEKLAPRGLMTDRNGVLLAGVRPELVITAVPHRVAADASGLERVANILNVPRERLKAKLDEGIWRPFLPTPVFVGATVQQGIKIAELADELPGIGVEMQPMRTYTDTTSFTHVMGSVRVPTEKDVERLKGKGVDPAAYVGRDGIERAYEAQLMGTPGMERLEVDAKQRPLRVIGRDNGVPGDHLILTLDARLQKAASRLLGAEKHRGAIVVIQPQTGEVLCMVSSPTFDQNLFRGGISQTEWTSLQTHPGKPMLNRAIQSSYSPGSTFKAVTALAALKAGRFSTSERIVCRGGYKIGNRFIKCMGHHGPVDFQRAFAKSCNTYFLTLAHRAGRDALNKASLEVGLGARTGIEIEGERRGIVPTDEWMRTHFRDPAWRGGDTLNMGIGQGYISATPIQMANLAALIANGGVNYRPHLVRKVERHTPNGESSLVTPEVAHQLDVGPEFWSATREAFLAVVESGTGQGGKIPGVPYGGKTGSTEHRRGALTHSWFIGFAPFQNPKIAFAVLVESAGHGGEIAVPIARELVRTYLAPKAASTAPANASASALAPSAAVASPAPR
jgi:penicillin-binding protein 2